MGNSVQTTLRLRALACGPVRICQSFLEGSALGEDEGFVDRRGSERKSREDKANMGKRVLVKNQQ